MKWYVSYDMGVNSCSNRNASLCSSFIVYHPLKERSSLTFIVCKNML